MPWFCLTALLHTIIVLEKRSVLQSWTIILSIASFTLSISGTFLVRSGILNSIHTFANDPSRGIFILIYLFLLVSLALFIYFIYFENEKKKEEGIFLINKETSILINNWFMMYFLAVVLVGTIYPIFLEVISNEKISIGPPFYHKLLIPFLILFIIIMILETKLKWIKTDTKKIKKNGLISFILLAIFCLILIEYLGSNLIIASILLASAFLLIVLTILDIIKNKIFISQKISHFGFSLLILSILLNNIYSKEISSNMKVGEEINFKDKKIKFLSLKATEKKNFKSITGKFQIIDEKNRIKFFYPEIRIYNQPNIVTSEADIVTNIFTDNFLIFNIINDDEFFNVRYQYKPFMFLIWISTMLIAIGGMYSLYNRTYEK